MFASNIGHEFSNDWMHQADSSGKLLIKQELYPKGCVQSQSFALKRFWGWDFLYWCGGLWLVIILVSNHVKFWTTRQASKGLLHRTLCACVWWWGSEETLLRREMKLSDVISGQVDHDFWHLQSPPQTCSLWSPIDFNGTIAQTSQTSHSACRFDYTVQQGHSSPSALLAAAPLFPVHLSSPLRKMHFFPHPFFPSVLLSPLSPHFLSKIFYVHKHYLFLYSLL